MDLVVKILTGAFITMSLLIGGLDLYVNKTMMTHVFYTRGSAQTSLYDIQDKYNNNEAITSVEMLNNWLIDFIDKQGIDYEEVRLKFHKIETEPPVYLVTVEGYEDEYAFINGTAYFEYTTGTTLITEEEKEDE